MVFNHIYQRSLLSFVIIYRFQLCIGRFLLNLLQSHQTTARVYILLTFLKTFTVLTRYFNIVPLHRRIYHFNELYVLIAEGPASDADPHNVNDLLSRQSLYPHRLSLPKISECSRIRTYTAFNVSSSLRRTPQGYTLHIPCQRIFPSRRASIIKEPCFKNLVGPSLGFEPRPQPFKGCDVILPN